MFALGAVVLRAPRSVVGSLLNVCIAGSPTRHRHELRCALGELQRGLDGLRSQAASAGTPDAAAWKLPPTYRVRYTLHRGELVVGGVFVRLFLKEPTFPLRNPRKFVESLLRRFLSESEHLIGMTSEDPDEVLGGRFALLLRLSFWVV